MYTARSSPPFSLCWVWSTSVPLRSGLCWIWTGYPLGIRAAWRCWVMPHTHFCRTKDKEVSKAALNSGHDSADTSTQGGLPLKTRHPCVCCSLGTSQSTTSPSA